MKKLFTLFTVLALYAGSIYAKPVTVTVAKSVAANYYRLNSSAKNITLNLVYTESEANGTPLYYVFNVNAHDGFVIVSAEDALQPIIGYSTVGFYGSDPRYDNKDYTLPDGFVYLMGKYVDVIRAARKQNISVSAEVANEWNAYATNHPEILKHPVAGTPASVAPLMQTLWGQDVYYRYLCPDTAGKYCATGCIATAMAQILRYWAYPHIGKGSNSYNESPYGTLSANFGKTKYNWQAMPLMLDTDNTQVETIMSQVGVSVDMNYGPGQSGAALLGGTHSAQYSYPNYFGYNSTTLHGGKAPDTVTTYTLLETELTAGRVVQYGGQDPGKGGHSWVCDGDNTSGSTPMFHMNWGWSGASDGYYAIGHLMNFTSGLQAITGIEPPLAVARFTGSQLVGCAGMSVTFTDQSLTPNSSIPVTAWSWSFPGGNPSTSTSQNPVITYSSPGTYNVTEVVTSSGGKDTITKTNYITVVPATSTLPYSQGFEGSSFPPAGWVIQQGAPGSYVNFGIYWKQNAVAGGFDKSKHSMFFDNWTRFSSDKGVYERIYTPAMNFTNISSNGEISFDVAYAPYNTSQSDTLDVYYSTNCGETWTQVYSKGGTKLATTTNNVASGKDSTAFQTDKTDTLYYFKPTKSEWRTETISLPAAVNGVADVMFAFENRSGNGEPIYIDNVNVTGTSVTTSVSNITAEPSAKLFPNPNNGMFTIDDVTAGQVIEIYNMLGQQLSSIIADNTTMNFNIANQTNGIYLVRIVNKDGSLVTQKKIVKVQ